MMNLTELETKTITAISDLTPDSYGEYSDLVIEELIEPTNETTKVLRGVISALIKKGLITVDDGGENAIYMTKKGYIFVGRNEDAN